MRLVIASTGASGAIYLQRLLAQIDCARNEIHLVLSSFARQVIHEELGQLQVPAGVREHNDRSMNVPFASGSTSEVRASRSAQAPMISAARRPPTT